MKHINNREDCGNQGKYPEVTDFLKVRFYYDNLNKRGNVTVFRRTKVLIFCVRRSEKREGPDRSETPNL